MRRRVDLEREEEEVETGRWTDGSLGTEGVVARGLDDGVEQEETTAETPAAEGGHAGGGAR